MSVGKVSQSILWLVKSGDQILGPFTHDELVAKICNRDIAIIDEVSSPESRWRYVRDEPRLTAAVEELRKGLMHSKEDTEVQGYTGNKTVATSLTQLDADTTQIATQVTNVSTAREVEVVGTTEAASVKSTPVASLSLSSSTAMSVTSTVSPLAAKPTHEAEPKRRPSKRRRRGLPWSTVLLAALAIIVTGVVVVVIFTPDSRSLKTEAASDLKKLSELAERQWNRGEFDLALKSYRDLSAAELNQPSDVLRFALLTLNRDGSTVEAKRTLEELLKRNSNGRLDQHLTEQIKSALGLVAFRNDDLDAAKNLFAQQKDSASRFNLGVIEYQQGAFDEAMQNFSASGGEPWSQLMLAKAMIAASDRSAADWKSKVLQWLDGVASRGQDFQQEAFVLSAYIDLLMGQKRGAASKVRAALETDPQQTEDHFHHPELLLAPVLSWKDIVPYCRKLDDDLGGNQTRSLLAICLAKTGDVAQAETLLAEPLARSPQDGWLQSANAFVSMNLGREENARASLGLAGRANGNRLAQVLLARLCSRMGEKACASELWSKLASEANAPLAALVQAAADRIDSGDRAAGVLLLSRAEKQSPRYLPAIRLRFDSSSKP
jgi:tetratricopeptide (TPR) repeat protein